MYPDEAGAEGGGHSKTPAEHQTRNLKGKADCEPPANPLLREFNLQGYYLQFQLSDEVDQSRISAESKNGELTVHLPKAEKSAFSALGILGG